MSPELRFAHWLRGYLDAHLARSLTPLDPLPASDLKHIRQELCKVTGDLQLHTGWRELSPADMIGQVFGAQAIQPREDPAYTAHVRRGNDLAGVDKQTHEKMQANALQQRRDPDCPAHDTRCTQANCYFQAAQRMGGVVELGGGYGIPRGVR